MDLAELTQRLGQIYAAGHTYRFVEQAHRVLAHLPDAPELTALTLRALTELGLGGPVRELLQLRRDLPDSDDLAKLRSAAAALPNGRVSWRGLSDVLEGNLEALLRQRPYLRETADSFEPLLRDLHLHRTNDGHYHISRRRSGRLREWLPDLSAPDDEVNLELPPRERLGAPLVVGLRVGPLTERLYDATHRVLLSHSKPIYLVEHDPARFAAWLHCADHRRLLDDKRVYVLVGGNAPEQLRHILSEQPALALPEFFITCCDDAAPAVRAREAIEQVGQRRRDELNELVARIEQRYRDRDAGYWAERFEPPGPVLGITSRYTTMLQYSTRDALHAFEELGYETHTLIEAEDHHTLGAIDMCRAVLELDPALILVLDHLRYEYPCLPRNLPFLTWIQDPMPKLLCRTAGDSIGSFDFVCGYYFDQCTANHGYPAQRFKPTEVPVSTRLFNDGDLDEATLRRHACDISFVSNASQPIDQFYQSFAEQQPPAIRPLLEALYQRVREVLDAGGYLSFHKTAAELVRSAAVELGLQLDERLVEELKTAFAFRLFDWGRRQETLEWVGDWARRNGRVLRIYGRGWEDHPRLAKFAAGVIEHGEPLRAANRASKLGLQLISTGFRHQRSYELLMCGALPLTRFCEIDFMHASVEQFLARRARPQREHAGDESLPRCSATIFPGFERIVFRTPEEFAELAERFLADDDYRRQVRDEIRDVVSRDCTYTGVVRTVAGAFSRQISEQAAQLSPIG